MIDRESRFAKSAHGAGASWSLTGGPSRRLAVRLGVLGVLVASVLALAASPAWAAYGHTTTTGEFGKEGPKATGLGNGCHLAYQSASHKLYLYSDSKIYGLDRTAPGVVSALAGNFPVTTGVSSGCGDPHIAVDNSATGSSGNIYIVPSSTKIYGWGPTGAPNAPWTSGVDAGGETCGVAVTNTGEVWGGTYGGAKVTKFSSSGSSNGSLSPGLGNNCKIAVDQSNNDLYIVKYNGSGVVKLSAASAYSTPLNFPAVTGNATIAVNGAKHRLYEPGGSQIRVYDTTTAALIETISIPGNTQAVAVDEATDTLFVSDTSKGFIREIPGANIPKATTGEPTGNTAVAGTADPDGSGNITECFFEVGTSSSNYTSTKECAEALPITGVTPVSAALEGLLGETTYHYRLVVGNANYGGRAYGADKTITPHNVKGLITEDATGVTRTSAELHSSFEGNGEPTTYYFEWGLANCASNPCTPSSPPPGESVGEPTFPPKTFLAFTPTGLTPEKTYHYRIVAENGLGKSPGADKTFTTLPAVQSLTTEAPSSVGAKVATLEGSYLGDGDATSYYYKYGKTPTYGLTTGVVDVGSPSGSTQLPAEISNLELETTYHYRVVATNSLGTTEGADMSFQTNPAVGGLNALPATDISQESITLNGEFMGNGENTHYYFEYGLSTKYGSKTAEPPGVDAGSPTGPTPISAVITDYEDYSTYHYRIVAVNSQGTTKSPDQTFVAPPAPLPSISGTSAVVSSPTTATMEANINPNRWATVYLFEYGTSNGYGENTEISKSIGSDPIPQTVSESVATLSPGTAYHFRVVAINFTGTAYGPDHVLITPDAPRIDFTTSSAVGLSSAHLSANVSPNSAATSVHFEFGTSTGYGAGTADAAIGSDADVHVAGADIAGLAAGTTYHFRTVASNQYGTTVGPDQTFTTLPAGGPGKGSQKKKVTCKKGFVKRHGKCVKRHKKKKHKKKHHKKKHRHSNRRHG